jgi:glucuronokinase
MTEAIAHARVGFVGNPADMYGGKTLSFTFGNFARVEVKDSLELKIHGEEGSDDHLTYNGSNDLIKATVRHLGLEGKSMDITYRTNIPIGAGLSGSSAIIIATLRAFNKEFNLGLNRDQIAEEALHIEVDELNIAAGFQDRYVISYGGVCFMDFTGKEYLRKTDPFGKVEQLAVSEIPFFLCRGTKSKSSAVVHNPLRDLFLKGGDTAIKIKSDMDRIADLAVEGKKELLIGDWIKLGKLMNKNTELRENLKVHLGKNRMHIETDLEMIDKALSYGAFGAKVAGSGGSIVVLSDNKEVYSKMNSMYFCLVPQISRYEG